MSMNQALVIGRLTKDPELKYTPQGIAVANFTVACDRDVAPDEQGEKPCDFIPCVAWRQSAEFAANYLSKGRLVAVRGRIQVRRWQAQDGTNRYSTEINVERIQGLDKPRDDAAAAPAAGGFDNDDPFGEQ